MAKQHLSIWFCAKRRPLPDKNVHVLSRIRRCPQVLYTDDIVAHIALFSTSRELARFCFTSRVALQLEGMVACIVARAQHGILNWDESITLREVYKTLDGLGDRDYFDFTEQSMITRLNDDWPSDVMNKPNFCKIDVGGHRTGYQTIAACPPSQGDSWRLLVPLRRGRYKLLVSGWRNPYHGKLDISLDGDSLSPVDGLDWYAIGTSPYTFPPMVFEVQRSGTHELRGETSRCNQSALGSKYWMCLKSIRIMPDHFSQADGEAWSLEEPVNEITNAEVGVSTQEVTFRTILRHSICRRRRHH